MRSLSLLCPACLALALALLPLSLATPTPTQPKVPKEEYVESRS